MQELERIADEQSLIIAVGYMLRYNPAIETAKALLEEVRPLACLVVDADPRCPGQLPLSKM